MLGQLLFITAVIDACSQLVIEWREFRRYDGGGYLEDEIVPCKPLSIITLTLGSVNKKCSIRAGE